MSTCAAIPQCCQPLLDYNIGSLFYSSAITQNCPAGFVGGPFTSAFGQFISTISQEDADILAQAYINDLVTLGCISGPTITTESPLPDGAAGTPYSETFAATGGISPYAWSLISGSLPSGLGFSGSGIISGTPTEAETSSFTVQVTDNNGISATKPFSLTIAPAPTPSVSVVFSIQNNNASPPGWLDPTNLLVSTDGSSYGTLVPGDAYVATTQLKFKFTIPTGFSTDFQNWLVEFTGTGSTLPTINYATSSVIASGAYTNSGNMVSLSGYYNASFTTTSPVTFGSTQAITSGNMAGGSQEVNMGVISGSITTEFNFEIILNLI